MDYILIYFYYLWDKLTYGHSTFFVRPTSSTDLEGEEGPEKLQKCKNTYPTVNGVWRVVNSAAYWRNGERLKPTFIP
jgi:hypothetical protein